MTKLISRRTVLGGAAAVGGMLAMPSIVRAQSDKVVNILGSEAFFPNTIRERFKAETGISVQYRQGTTDASQSFNILASEGQRETDIVQTYGHRNYPFIAAGYFEGIEESRVPSISKINPVYLNDKAQKIEGVRYGIPVAAGFMLSVFRKSAVAEDQRDSWEPVFGDSLAGRLSWRTGGIPLAVIHYLGIQDAWWNFENTPEGAARVEDMLKQVASWVSANKQKIVKWYETGAEVQQLFYGNEIDAAHALTDMGMALVASDPEEFGRAIPKEGVHGYYANYSIATGAPHKDDAYKFIEFLLGQPDANGEIIRSTGGVSTLIDSAAGLTPEEAERYAFTDEELSHIHWLSVLGADDPRFPLMDKYVATLKEV